MSTDDLALDPADPRVADLPTDTGPARESFDVEPPYDPAVGDLPR